MTVDELVAYCLAKPGATEDYPWGEEELTAKVGGKVFACEHDGELLTKLPPDRIDELKAKGARDFEPMAGRRMNGWVKVPEPDETAVRLWTVLAEEAKAFVAGTA